ncbi:S-layer family protein [Nostoc sp. FACHB-152]|uniref:two-partner secretion domain-containing protein n=1 Tax=unclassified Nostoc TaxID=2593658 RepID=UPI001689F27A|nr:MULTISPECIES: S-layer family protein [unclassified Nostoc]MBD2451175.1 S-layer family protein [Nostoc sp. FACHB-152]MBD2470025.1 S-layer family protein [Nostoc sp. FACHB-145]
MKLFSNCWGVVNRIWAGSLLLSGIILFWQSYAHAQVTSDGSLNTTVLQSGKDFTITNGHTAGNNLFHSFSQFSVPSGGSAFFNNAATIENIFARVTGSNASNIDGLIRANVTANLFLLNSAGIVFGPNAQLNIGGSFVASTANTVIFADGTKFGIIDTTSPPLLTMSVPVGLQLGANAGSITVQGSTVANSFFRPPTLSLTPNQTLALVGSQINVDSAKVSAPDGRIELWAVRDAQVTINNQTPWEITNSAATADWGTITLQQASSVDASGINGGAINIRGRGLTVQEGSNISSSTLAGQGKGITVQTTDFVDLLGVSLPGQFNSSVGTSVGSFFAPPAIGRAGDVTVETGRLRLSNGAWLQSSSYSNNSRAGDVTVRAADVEVVGVNPFLESIPTSITTTLFSGTNNESGKISIEANRVRVLNGGIITTALVNINPASSLTGKSGDISIRATESLEISGYTPVKLLSGVSTAITPFAEGQAGNIMIDVGLLKLSNGGTVRSNLSGKGKAGNITIQAKKVAVSEPELDVISNLPGGITVSVGNKAVGSGGNITIAANSLRVFNGGQITSSSQGQGSAGNINLQVKTIDVQGVSPSPLNGQYFKSAITASSTTTFAAGSVNITTDSLSVRDGAEITVSNSGTGDAGNLNINAQSIFLDNGANLRAGVNGGNRGNIRLGASDFLLLRHGSQIMTDALGASIGGNIAINAGSIVAVPTENSDISANAVLGSGGNIQITTQGIFGLQFGDQLTAKSDITASSQFGVSGTVQVNTVGVDPNSGLVELPANITDPSQQIATGCSKTNGSSFVATGRGGVQQNPTQEVSSDRTWSDIRDISAFRKTQSVKAQIPTSSEVIVQATSWHRNAQGQVELVAVPSPTQVQPHLTCAAVPEI